MVTSTRRGTGAEARHLGGDGVDQAVGEGPGVLDVDRAVARQAGGDDADLVDERAPHATPSERRGGAHPVEDRPEGGDQVVGETGDQRGGAVHDRRVDVPGVGVVGEDADVVGDDGDPVDPATRVPVHGDAGRRDRNPTAGHQQRRDGHADQRAGDLRGDRRTGDVGQTTCEPHLRVTNPASDDRWVVGRGGEADPAVGERGTGGRDGEPARATEPVDRARR